MTKLALTWIYWRNLLSKLAQQGSIRLTNEEAPESLLSSFKKTRHSSCTHAQQFKIWGVSLSVLLCFKYPIIQLRFFFMNTLTKTCRQDLICRIAEQSFCRWISDFSSIHSCKSVLPLESTAFFSFLFQA